jgi:hypothetical protein
LSGSLPLHHCQTVKSASETVRPLRKISMTFEALHKEETLMAADDLHDQAQRNSISTSRGKTKKTRSRETAGLAAWVPSGAGHLTSMLIGAA